MRFFSLMRNERFAFILYENHLNIEYLDLDLQAKIRHFRRHWARIVLMNLMGDQNRLLEV